MNIRRAEEKDIERIHILLHQVQDIHAQGRPDLFKCGARKYTDEELAQIITNENSPIFVYADREDTVLGYIFCVYTEVLQGHPTLKPIKGMYIDDLCVDETKRGIYIGKALYEHALAEAKRNGCYQVTLHVWECNEPAKKFYEEMGLKPLTITMEKIID